MFAYCIDFGYVVGRPPCQVVGGPPCQVVGGTPCYLVEGTPCYLVEGPPCYLVGGPLKLGGISIFEWIFFPTRYGTRSYRQH